MENNQKAGNNSKQMLINNVNVGLTLNDVMNIVKNEKELILKDAQLVAEETARKRINEFSEIFVPRLESARLLSSFSDPVIQCSYRNAEKTAICTERKTDYEILSELLIHRINRKDDYTKSAAIEKAIAEVNNISEEALMVLTIVFAVTTYVPISGKITNGLKALDDLYGKLLKNFSFPNTDKWLDNLDVTNCIKTNMISKHKKLEDYFSINFNGYVTLGIKKDSENYIQALEMLKQNGLPQSFLIENELNTDFVRLEMLTQEVKNEIKIDISQKESEFKVIQLNDKQQDIIEKIIKMYEKANEDTEELFKKQLMSYNNIKEIIEWWNNVMINHFMQITPIGKVLAHTNAKRLDSSLPDLD